MLSERARTFFVLLNEMYKLKSENILEEMMIASSPYMEEGEKSRITTTLEVQSRDIINEEDNDYSNLDKLKSLLNGS